MVTQGREKTIMIEPPILSRVYNQLGNGIVSLNNARKITEFPIPFPLAQMITFMLLFHWLITAFICAASVERSFWAGILSFIVTFSFHSINYIAMELEMPFGDDANDLPLYEMQADLNASIKSLMHHLAQNPPHFAYKPEHKLLKCRGQSMEDIFEDLKKSGPKLSSDAMADSPDTGKSFGSPVNPDNEKSHGNAMVMQAASAHGAARPRELLNGSSKNLQMSKEPQVRTLPNSTPEIWFHMGPNDSKGTNDTQRPDAEAPWKAQSVFSVAALHNALPRGGARKVSPQVHNALPLGGAPTVSPQVSPLPDLPLQLQLPPELELSLPSLADPMLGAPTSEKPMPAYRAPCISTTTRDAAGLPVKLQALQEYNDAASFPAPLAAPSFGLPTGMTLLTKSRSQAGSTEIRKASHFTA